MQELVEILHEVGEAASELGRRLETSEPDRVRELDTALRLAELENQGLKALVNKYRIGMERCSCARDGEP